MNQSENIETTRKLTVPNVSIFQLLERSVNNNAADDAVIDGERKLSFSQLKESSEHFAAALHNRGFRKGDRLALMVANGIDHCASQSHVSSARIGPSAA